MQFVNNNNIILGDSKPIPESKKKKITQMRPDYFCNINLQIYI